MSGHIITARELLARVVARKRPAPNDPEEQVQKFMDFLYYFEPEAYGRLSDPRRRAKLLEWLA